MDERAIKEHFCYRELSHGPCNVVKQELICAAISVISLRRNGASFTDEAPPTPAAQPPPPPLSAPPYIYSRPSQSSSVPYEARTHRQWKRGKGTLTTPQASRVSVPFHERNSRF